MDVVELGDEGTNQVCLMGKNENKIVVMLRWAPGRMNSLSKAWQKCILLVQKKMTNTVCDHYYRTHHQRHSQEERQGQACCQGIDALFSRYFIYHHRFDNQNENS